MKRLRQSAVRHKARPLALLNFVVNKTASFFLYSFRQFSTWKRNWIKDDKRSNSLKIKAFSVCRNYTVRAQLRFVDVGQRCADEADPGMAGTQRLFYHSKHLRAPGLQFQAPLGGRDAEQSGAWKIRIICACSSPHRSPLGEGRHPSKFRNKGILFLTFPVEITKKHRVSQGQPGAFHKNGGDGGIRTHVPFHRLLDFESSSLWPLRYVSI